MECSYLHQTKALAFFSIMSNETSTEIINTEFPLCPSTAVRFILVRVLSGVRFSLYIIIRVITKSDLLIMSMITDRHRTTRSPLTN